jgi:hypothetical protein
VSFWRSRGIARAFVRGIGALLGCRDAGENDRGSALGAASGRGRNVWRLSVEDLGLPCTLADHSGKNRRPRVRVIHRPRCIAVGFGANTAGSGAVGAVVVVMVDTESQGERVGTDVGLRV